MPDVTVVLGDITTQHVDAVVNAANNAMRGGGGVDGAIHRAGGPALLQQCVERFPRGLATGDAGWTTAGAMPARWVIHTVGPNYRAGQTDRALLVSCYQRSLSVADELGAQSVAFPLISAGVYGWPHEDAVRVAIETFRTTRSRVDEARLVAFDRATLLTAQAILREVPRPSIQQPIALPLTRAKVHALAFERADDPAGVTEVVHDGYAADLDNGGFAFHYDDTLLIYGRRGGWSTSIDPGDDAGRRAQVDRYWAETKHSYRPLALSEVSPLHRAAIAALVAGVDRVGDLPASTRVDIPDVDLPLGDYLLVTLTRRAKEPTEQAALRALAGSDSLLDRPTEYFAAHRCPLCGRPAIGRAWDWLVVCDHCFRRTVCAEGRPVHGYNTHVSGGCEARHDDGDGVCQQATADGRVWVDGHECHLSDAKFGGVFVGVRPADA